jgi:7-keto-8-aminopelargonate synthetase-like enzyme
MLTSSNKNDPIQTVLRVAMVVDKKPHEKGEVVVLSHRDYVYLANHKRVAEATPENVKAVEAEIESEKEAELLREENARLRAELAAAKKGK